MAHKSDTPYFKFFVEGKSDIPLILEVMRRKFNLIEIDHFMIYPHRGRGQLPKNLHSINPDKRKDQSLLNQLPTKLKNMAYLPKNECVIVLIDADKDEPKDLLDELNQMLQDISKHPTVRFCLAIEEMESWFIADTPAVLKAYPKANINKLTKIKPDAICNAWEKLAQAIGITDLKSITGKHKEEWAKQISPHLELDNPPSDSFQIFLNSIRSHLYPTDLEILRGGKCTNTDELTCSK